MKAEIMLGKPPYGNGDPTGGIDALRACAETCKACPLWENATQTVFGRGPEHARLMIVGEQPGDQEDLAGEPFVGPSGQILRAAMDEAGLNPEDIYITNAVKHFKWIPSGNRRLHAKPNRKEVLACQPWLIAEIAAVRPDLIVCLGATAAQSLMGAPFKITQQRGQLFDSPHGKLLATYHPSALLRMPDPAMREEAHRNFVDDLRTVAKQLVTSRASLR